MFRNPILINTSLLALVNSHTALNMIGAASNASSGTPCETPCICRQCSGTMGATLHISRTCLLAIVTELATDKRLCDGKRFKKPGYRFGMQSIIMLAVMKSAALH